MVYRLDCALDSLPTTPDEDGGLYNPPLFFTHIFSAYSRRLASKNSSTRETVVVSVYIARVYKPIRHPAISLGIYFALFFPFVQTDVFLTK